MNQPAIWQAPLADAIIKNGARSFVDGDAVSISYLFLRDVTKVEYIKGTVPFGVEGRQDGLLGTMLRKDPNVNTPPRDYRITVRATTRASAQEILDGLPVEWSEDRTFTIVGGLWFGPSAGELTNSAGAAYVHGDVVNVQFTFDPARVPLKRLTLIGGQIPPGLAFSAVTRKVSGTLGALPKGITEYPMLFRAEVQGDSGDLFQDRAFSFKVNPLDERHGWDLDWLNSLEKQIDPALNDAPIYILPTQYRGKAVEVELKVNNPDNDPLVFKATGFPAQYQTWFEGLPRGLTITNDGKLVGTPIIAENEPGYYFFKVYARDPVGAEGTPRTSELVFRLYLDPEIRLDQQLNDSVRWLTPAGSIGSTYETYHSHCAIRAVPQFDLTALNNEYQTVQYQLLGSSPFPTGVSLQSDTGYIVGQMPHVTAEKTYSFTVRARVVFINRTTGNVRPSTAYSDRNFSFTVKNLYITDTVSNVYISVPPFDRKEISEWVYGNKAEFRDSDPRAPSIMTVLGREVLFRRDDQAWGRVEQPRILLLAGLLTPTPNVMLKALRDYHHKIDLRINELKWAKGLDPSGNYVYDVLYFNVFDPMHGAGGFDAFGADVLQTFSPSQPDSVPNWGEKRYQNRIYNKAIPQHNLPAGTDRYHPMSLENARKDLMKIRGRSEWAANQEVSSARGLGVPGKEGLPLWMMCEQTKGDASSVLGYTPAIELAYLKPGNGAQAVKTLIQAGFQKALQGRPIKVDRYLLISDGLHVTEFDFNIVDETIMTFDGPDSVPATSDFTTFDETYIATSKYYKFPPGDA